MNDGFEGAARDMGGRVQQTVGEALGDAKTQAAGLYNQAAGQAQQQAAPPLSADQIEFFEKKIRPIFVERCYKCHSAASEKVKGGLLLDSREGLLKGGDSGPAGWPADVSGHDS